MEYALQLYSLRDDTAKKPEETIRKVGEMGYTAVETCGYYGKTAKELKALFDSAGLKSVSAHIGWQRLLNNFGEEAEYNHAIGNTRIILPYFKMSNSEEAKRAVDVIAEMRDNFVKEGFAFGYHNHDFEFKPLDDNGTCAMDYLHQIDGLMYEPDVFWIKTAGLDPIRFINDNAGKIIAVHLKEYRADGFNIELGNGILPWREIMAAANKAGTDLGIVEQEEYTCAPIDSVKICVDNLKKIFG